MSNWNEAIDTLRNTMPLLEAYKEGVFIQQGKTEVISRYQPLFSKPETLSWEDFESFLYFKNNKHWTSLYRQKRRLEARFNDLRDALALLSNDEQPIEDRLNQLMQKGSPYNISGFGKGLMTAILLVVSPDKYGVWNGTSENGMKILGLFPGFERGEKFGSRYTKFNEILLGLAKELEVDLWTLDTLWYMLTKDTQEPEVEVEESVNVQSVEHRFGLELHLQEFLIDHWDSLPLAKEWTILEEDGDLTGFEYRTDIGRIDLLAQSRKGLGWLVIELKRGQTEDKTVGQVQRYMGWVKRNLADDETPVKGLIICFEATEKLHYALDILPKGLIEVMEYGVNFYLKPTSH